ncbi:MAG: hypothetical protein OXG68_14455 [Chloroflexi bacterium]|nr:hypothetical protein [Chloroflexota bacterium]
MSDSSARLLWPPFIYELADLVQSVPTKPPIYLVGGAVRDACLRREVDDIDIAVNGDAVALARWVADAWQADIYIMDRERGVARVFVKRDERRVTIDFARFRGSTLAADLRDRDFTMNAMAADLLRDPGELIDPLDGASDLRQRTLRRCSPRSIADDPIRALRAVRLSVQFALKIHPDTAADIRKRAKGLRRTSPERLRDELFKLLSLDKSARGLRVLGHLSLLQYVFPPLAESEGRASLLIGQGSSWTNSLAAVERMSVILKSISGRRTDNTAAAFDLGMLVIQLDRFRALLQTHFAHVYGTGRSRAALLVLAAALHGASAKEARALAKSLMLTSDEQRRLPLIIESYRQIAEQAEWSKLDLHRFWHRLGDCGIDAVLLASAFVLGTEGSQPKQGDWLKFVERVLTLLDAYFNRFDEVVEPKLLLDGSDIQTLLNVGPGPMIGQLLTALREAQVTGEVRSVADARDFVRRYAASLESAGGSAHNYD